MKLALPKWWITISNKQLVTTLVLLRERANAVGATSKRHWEVMQNITPSKFTWKSRKELVTQ